jgi:predicted SnoaL-like aldol condensation-catalyzing enzyme
VLEASFVVVHGRIRLKPDMPEYVLIHIFRFEGDRIIEEWEAGQEIPKGSPNKNGVF